MSAHSPADKSSQQDHDDEKLRSPIPPEVVQNAKVIQVENIDYALALSTGPQLKATSARSLQLFAILLIAFMGSLSNGFDGSVMSAVNGMDQYLDYFSIDGKDAGGGVGTTTALIFGIYSIGSIAGVLIAGPVTDKFGRRGGMALGSAIIIAGAIVVTVAKDVSYLLGGRFFLGFGVAITTTAAPAYVVEMSPPQWRGRLTGLYNTFYYSGSILCTGITIATGRINGAASWRIPLAIQIAPATVLALFAFILPESPRWLLAVGRKAEALEILAKYHGNGDHNAPLVQLEWKEYEQGVKLDASDKRWWDYSELFNTRNARYRTFMMLLMGFFGASFLGHWIAIPLILPCYSSNGLEMVSGCTAKWGKSGANPAGANAAIAFIFLFGFVYSLTYTPLQALYPAECLDYNTRAKGMALYAFAVSCASFVNTYAGPIALGRITWRYYIVYIAWDLFECAVIWFCAVETKGRTLEELNEIFEDPNPVKASTRKHKVAIVEKGDGKELITV
ncbi:hypothetical protein NLJ89_g1216 [Agrocybe chaxingu]|uniref:Major facilitator superfamily (MFS) profile domain-containing protein n=1 Tax=Agrocybe chaxingu TaxID=84603 RepID=A0A9W8N0H7_9AGAR|nr:hypothetical protein NLJ89_g1216 [Agrocybe chaxingu]